MKKIGSLLAIGVVAAGTVAALAEPAMASDYNRTVRICNHANERIQVARVLDESGSMVSRGWYGIDNGDCVSLVGRFMRIKSASHTWNFRDSYTTQFCVSREAFRIYQPSGQASCSTAGGYMATFSSVPAGDGVLDFIPGPAQD